MRKTFLPKLAFALLLLAVALSGCISSYNHSSPEKLGKTVFKLLKNQDQAGIKFIIPNEADLESYLATADMPEDELAAFKEEMKQIIAEFQGAANTSFERSSDAASREGIVLSKAKLGDIRSKTWQGPDNELANIDADITYGGKKYLLKIENAGKVASGWVVSMDGFTFAPAKE
jgi:hypothetical protein